MGCLFYVSCDDRATPDAILRAAVNRQYETSNTYIIGRLLTKMAGYDVLRQGHKACQWFLLLAFGDLRNACGSAARVAGAFPGSRQVAAPLYRVLKYTVFYTKHHGALGASSLLCRTGVELRQPMSFSRLTLNCCIYRQSTAGFGHMSRQNRVYGIEFIS